MRRRRGRGRGGGRGGDKVGGRRRGREGAGGAHPKSIKMKTHRGGREGSSLTERCILDPPLPPSENPPDPLLKARNPAQGRLCSPSSHPSSCNEGSPAKPGGPQTLNREDAFPSRNKQVPLGTHGPKGSPLEADGHLKWGEKRGGDSHRQRARPKGWDRGG